MNTKLLSLLLIIAVLAGCNSKDQSTLADKAETYGPQNGSLVIVGGAMKDTSIVDKFISLAGGSDASIVVIPTASGASEFDNTKICRFLNERGAHNTSVLHTYDSKIADTEEFVKPLKEADGVWFTGGRQWRLVDAYAGTLTEKEIAAVTERGGVIGGSSAGATIQGTYLARGDTKTNTIMMGDHEKGFNYLKGSAIDQHLLVRNRQHDLVEVIKAHPGLLGIGLDENTAVIVKGNTMEVLGQSFVAVYDYKLWPEYKERKQKLANGGRFFLLRSGDKYDLNSRKVIEWSGGNNRDIFSISGN